MKFPIKNNLPELNVAVNAVLEAGSKVLGIYGGKFSVEYKEENNPLTEADLKSNEILVKHLSKIGCHIISEEIKDDIGRLEKDKVWIIDPLDGTSDFVKKTGEFTIMIALVDKNIPVLGVIYWPTKDILYIAEKDKGAFKLQAGEWTRIKCSDISVLSKVRAVVSRNHLTENEKEIFNDLGIAKFTPRGSSLKAMDISNGDADLYFTTTNKIKQWDTAASYCILTEAGGRITDTLGNEIKYNAETLNHEFGILMSNGKIHDQIINELKRSRL